jgi:hypothetical protein
VRASPSANNSKNFYSNELAPAVYPQYGEF